MSKENLNKLCRLCATKLNQTIGIYIFEEHGIIKQLNKKIHACLSIQVLETDNLPKIICYECYYKLELCFIFREKSVQTQSHLISLTKNILEKPEVILGTIGPNFTSHELDPNAINAIQLHSHHGMELNATETQSNSNLPESVIKIESDEKTEIYENVNIPSASNTQYEFVNANNLPYPVKIEACDERTENSPSNNLINKDDNHFENSLKTPKPPNEQMLSNVEANNNSYNNEGNNLTGNSEFASNANCEKMCKECGKYYKTIYKCSNCDKTFWTKTSLAQHEVVHTGKKPRMTSAEKMRAYRERQREKRKTENLASSQSVQTKTESTKKNKKPSMTSAEKVRGYRQRQLEKQRPSQNAFLNIDSKQWYIKPTTSTNSATINNYVTDYI